MTGDQHDAVSGMSLKRSFEQDTLYVAGDVNAKWGHMAEILGSKSRRSMSGVAGHAT